MMRARSLGSILPTQNGEIYKKKSKKIITNTKTRNAQQSRSDFGLKKNTTTYVQNRPTRSISGWALCTRSRWRPSSHSHSNCMRGPRSNGGTRMRVSVLVSTRNTRWSLCLSRCRLRLLRRRGRRTLSRGHACYLRYLRCQRWACLRVHSSQPGSSSRRRHLWTALHPWVGGGLCSRRLSMLLLLLCGLRLWRPWCSSAERRKRVRGMSCGRERRERKRVAVRWWPVVESYARARGINVPIPLSTRSDGLTSTGANIPRGRQHWRLLRTGPSRHVLASAQPPSLSLTATYWYAVLCEAKFAGDGP